MEIWPVDANGVPNAVRYIGCFCAHNGNPCPEGIFFSWNGTRFDPVPEFDLRFETVVTA